MPNTTLTLATLRQHAADVLGEGIVDIELKAGQHAASLRRTMATYNRYRAPWKTAVLTGASSATKRYALTQTGLRGVIDVQFVPTTISSDALDPFSLAQTAQQSQLSPTYGEMEQERGYLEQARRVMATDPDWYGQREDDGVYYLYVDIRSPHDVMFTYVMDLTADDNATTGLSQVDTTDVDWFLDYYVAQCSTMLGRGLRKHGGVAMPEGGTESLDGESLRSEAREDLTRLEDTIKSRRRPLPIVTG